jgi:O-succinylbenzoic acid--CoA ligase
VIGWDDRRTEILLNPRLPADDLARVHRLIRSAVPLEAHVWLTTSGATDRLKPVALAKRALLVSAAAVNRHLDSDARDVWMNVLPVFHVGGLGIHARAHLSGARVAEMTEWNALDFTTGLAAERATLTSVVPAHVYDLVQAALPAPPAIRAVVVGGGALPPDLWRRARALGWPVLPSYGATECASQIATAAPGGTDAEPPPMRLLPHVEVRSGGDGRLEVRSDALFTGYATETGLVDPRRDGWWRTDDLGEVAHGTLVVQGRADETVKVGGELVNLAALDARLDEVRRVVAPAADAALVRVADPRLGWVLGLAVATDDPGTARAVSDAYNAAVLPYERARVLRHVPVIPRTALGKVARRALEERWGTGDGP